MASKPVCLVCKKEMELGFMTDLSDFNTVNLPRWCPGTPEKGSAGLDGGGEAKRTQHKNGFRVVAYRCPECEALRLYAPSHEPASH
jgi:hypothetical protein